MLDGILLTSADLRTELTQLRQEGRQTAPVEPAFARLLDVELREPLQQARALALLDRCRGLPQREGYPFQEPSDLSAIRALRPAAVDAAEPAHHLPAHLGDRLLGAWEGRCAGCLLGKPVEGWTREKLQRYLERTGRRPLDGYLLAADGGPEVWQEFGIDPSRGCFADQVNCMPEDDDINYSIAALEIYREHGPAFSTDDVARFWLANLALFHTFTAERAAYRNACAGLRPPETALYHNPWREWIGAQIRADTWGYLCPGDPRRAAELAWRDARLSHVKNGVYGAMLAAAMVAAAFRSGSPTELLLLGLAEVPATSRLAAAIARIMRIHGEGGGYDEAVADIHTEWDDSRPHDWCHTISNAMVVAVALLWGDMDFSRTICLAVEAGFDTDCNAATAGSIVGAAIGHESLPKTWLAVLRDRVRTGLACRPEARISELAAETEGLCRESPPGG